MARPLKKDFTKDITAHFYMNGKLKEGKLLKQVGYNKYIVVNGEEEKGIPPFIMRLVSKEDAKKYKEDGMGYVVVSTKDGEKSLAKLTKNIITCTDGSVYPFEYEYEYDLESNTGSISLLKDSAKLEGVAEVKEEVEEEVEEEPGISIGAGDSMVDEGDQ